MMKKSHLFWVIGFGLMMIAGVLWGQTDDEISMEDIFKLSLDDLLKMEVVGVSKYEQGLSKAPATAIIISQKQIEERGYQDLSDVLKDVPGFDIIDHASRFGEYYTIRGIDSNDRFLVLVDGHKINPYNGTFLSVGNSISIRFAKQIEIIYGPASAIYGADAFSGIINIISTEPSEKSNVTAGVNTGSQNRMDAYLNLQLKLKKDLMISVMGRLLNTNGPDFTGKGYNDYDTLISSYIAPQRPAFEQPVRDHNAFVKIDYKNFSLNYFRQYFNEGNGSAMSPNFYVFNKENKWALSTDILWGVYTKEFKKNENGSGGIGGILTVDLSYIYHRQDPDTMFYKWLKAGNTAGGAFFQYMTGRDENVKCVLTYNNNISKKVQFIAGLEYEHSSGIPPYANDEVLGNSYKYEGDNAKRIDALLRIKESRYAGFGQFTYSPSSRVDIVIGGRYDHSHRYDGTFNPRVGLIINPFPKTNIKVLYGTAFQAPSLFYEYEQFGVPLFAFRSTNEIRTQEDPEWHLKNQKLKTHELSITQTIGKNVQISASVYYNQLSDLIERVMYDTTGSTWNKYFNKYTNGQRNENVGIQKITGGSLSLNGVISQKINGYLHYSYTDAITEKQTGDVPSPRVAKHKLWMGASFNQLFKYVTISPRFKWVGDINAATTNSIFKNGIQPGYTSLDVSISVKNLIKHTHFYGFIGNILGSRIEHAGLFEQSGIYAPLVPQEGFHFRIGMEVNLSM